MEPFTQRLVERFAPGQVILPFEGLSRCRSPGPPRCIKIVVGDKRPVQPHGDTGG